MRHSLSVFPKSAKRAVELLNDPETNLYDLRELVDSEPAYAAGLLRVANSPLFRGTSAITSTAQAIVRLGWVMVGNVILSLAMREWLPESPKTLAAWRASVLTGAWSFFVCRERRNLNPDTGFTAGLLSGIGEIVGTIPDYEDRCDPEERTVGILKQWHLPNLLIDSAHIDRNLIRIQRRGRIEAIPDAVALGAVFANRRRVPEDFAPLLADWRHLSESAQRFALQFTA